MNTINLKQLRIGVLTLLVAALFGFSFLWVDGAQAASLPADTCTYNAATNTRTCVLWATSGSFPLPGGGSTTIWGYTANDPGLGGSPELPGPVIIANQGETLVVILHNNLPESTSLFFAGMSMVPDLTGVAPGGMKTYTFSVSQPGTFLYEAGLTANSQHQVAMGLFGALVVRPAGLPGQAYADPATAFSDEALVVLSEIDPDLNNSANPAAFDMRNFTPSYWLINGKAYPNTEVITSAAGGRILLRYINAGLYPHTMNLLGVDQTLLAVDGSPLPYVRRTVVNTLAPGQTLDTLASMPAIAPAGDGMYALYDGSFLTHNNGAAGFGGMLAFLIIPDGTPPSTGPTTRAVALTPNPTNGATDVILTATINGAAGTTIMAAEYFTGTTGLAGSGVPMTATDGAFDEQVEDITITIPANSIALLGSGDHTFYVHAQDSTSTWGSFNFAVLHLDMEGPMTMGIVLTPNPSSGSVAVAIQATGHDSMSGNSNVVAAEYVIDDMMGAWTAMTVSPIAPIASLNATIPPATMSGLAEGEHILYVRSQDAFGNTGMEASAPLKVDKTGPVGSSMSIVPNLLYSRAAVRVNITLNDLSSGTPGVYSNVMRAEGFINTVGADGSGFPLTPIDGQFNSSSEAAYAIIPLGTVNTLPEGINTLYVHGQDSSGNWGAVTSAILTIMPESIFADGFESGSFSAWSGGSIGTASVAIAPAARSGTYGMQVVLAGNTPGYAIDNSPTVDPAYRARFYFHPNSTATGNNTTPNILVGLDSGGNVLFRVQYNRTNQGVYRVRVVVTRAGGTTTSAWTTINNAWNNIEIAWQSANLATFRLYIGGVLRQSLTGLNTSAYKLETVWLGPSGNLSNSVSGTMYFDDFVSKRNLYIGP